MITLNIIMCLPITCLLVEYHTLIASGQSGLTYSYILSQSLVSHMAGNVTGLGRGNL